ncbi:hypothetical protein HY639_02755 [Candidatus Woesearchaeota archaeon]|nr:hypothetical protein [Candidatus Woesearchaeota archaeon]
MLVLPVLGALGYIAGHALAVIAPEEIPVGIGYLRAFARVLFLILISVLMTKLSLVVLLVGVCTLFYPRAQHAFLALASGLLVGGSPTALMMSMGFLIGLPVGSLATRSEAFFLGFLFLLAALPWHFA